MRNKYFFLIPISIFFILSFKNINAQILLLPEIEQEQDNWCWAAVSKCILNYSGFIHQQCDIAEYARFQNNTTFGNISCCLDPTGLCDSYNWMWGNPGSIMDILYNFGSIITTNINAELSEIQWQTEISNNAPFIIRFGDNYGWGHFVVGYGISGTDYYTMDPWINEGYTISTYNWLITGQGGGGSWTHTQKLPSLFPLFILEKNSNKELLKVTDLLGRETKQTNQPLLYLQDDVTLYKRIFIE